MSFDKLLKTKIQAKANVKGVKKEMSVGKSNDVNERKLTKLKPLLVTYSINFRDVISHIKHIKKSVIYKNVTAICLKI